MRNWRELGEVPDSDDDGFDDTDSHPDVHDDSEPRELLQKEVGESKVEEAYEKQAPTEQEDIWSIPSSSPAPVSPSQPAPWGLASQVLGQAPSSSQSVRQRAERGRLCTVAEDVAGSATPTPERQPCASDISFPQDEISTGYVRVTGPASRASSPVSLLSRTPTPPESPSLPRARPTTRSPSRDRAAPRDEEQGLSRHSAFRFERSLRPRKPIQQHPYLLENAQYTNIMKSHGVKPIRVIQEPQPTWGRAEEEDSQDQAFEVEESQEASGGGLEGLEDSGPILFDDDQDELTLTPSLPKTSPGQHLRASSQQSSAGQTDATSLSDDDLPPLERLGPMSAKKRQELKRQRSQLLSSTSRKRARFMPDSSPQGSPPRPAFIPPPPPNVWELSSSPSRPQPSQEWQRNLRTAPKSPAPRPASTAEPSRPSLTDVRRSHGATDSPIVINEDTQSATSDGDSTGSSDSSESDSDVVRQVSRRIRGVLPASWLRLDRHQEKPAASILRRRSPEPSPQRVVRRGVALPRQASPKPTSTAPVLLFDESEESDGGAPRRTIEADDPTPTPPAIITIDEDDGATVVEEDTIDWMLPGRNRFGSHNTLGRAKKPKRSGAQAVFKGRPNQPSRQSKIDQALGRTKHGASSRSAKSRSTNKPRRKGDGSPAPRRLRKRAATPPLLSILDVVEPDAPKFVKIAARAVKWKANLGKTGPAKKLISLATRSDNLDALSVLRDWKSGKTRPRIPTPSTRKPEKPRSRPALEEIPTNTALRRLPAYPSKLVRQSNLDGFVNVGNESNVEATESPPISHLEARKPVRERGPNLHPAQLEAEEGDDKRRQLNSRKRTLDTFYRRTRRTLDALTDDGLSRVLDFNFTLREPPIRENHIDNVELDVEKTSSTENPKLRAARRKLRKGCRPQHVDLEAPQYARANDPLPAHLSVIEPQEHHLQSRDKLQGLGPYGTHYTHHFEVFPLDRGIFFHESTVIGRGSVRDAIDSGLSGRVRHQRPTGSFSLDGQTLRWGFWDDKTSSEFGILVDWVGEQLCSETTEGESSGRKAIEAADFVLGYILRSLSIRSDPEEKAFVSRCLEVFSSFLGRFESVDWGAVSESVKRAQLEVVVRFTTAMLAVHSLAHASGGDPLQIMKLDELLSKSASITVRRLLECGMEELQTLYGDLQRSTFRERGIRSDQVLANCWVVMIRVLESAGIPRCSFWDVAHSVMLSQQIASGSDAQAFERLWQNTFTLLPLCEIDNSGILVPGMRHTSPVEGWSLPQQLLKRVFQLYQTNPRQPPGFNDYCRALVARCHFLVEQWGWRKCTGIIGTIFDFFGSQSLAHLRNEEVYKSPRFLEELDRKPSLSIDPEDRCFHIFIKLLALTIQRLKELGRLKDIKNMVARTLPNHNRQYLKEDTIHQHDLAALRNHHDLICTLFWVSPPDLRPAVHLVEKLIIPSSAHKEACLINVRAWNQLARFVISSGEGIVAFRPLAAWRNNVFNQVLDQYLSAASDIEQQFRALSSEMAGISKEVRDEMVAKNKASALDVLHFSVKASLDVLKRAPTLEAALYALNTGQLQKVFTSLDYRSPGFDWSILRVAIETLEHFVGRIDEASEEQFSSEFSDNVDTQHLEEAVMLVNEHLTKDFFLMSRTTLALPLDVSPGRHSQQVACVEKAVTLSAKIAARFIKNRVTQMSPYFSAGKYGLFCDLPKNLTTPERRYLPLFLAVLVKNHIFDFKDLGTNLLGLWMLSIVKPLRFLGYENYLAEVLQHHHLPFLERATVAVGIPPDYNSNIDFFACAIHYMRSALRESGSIQSKQHRDEFSKTLQLVMRKMKEDLALLRYDTTEHGPYIDFVRQVISLIKSHGVGICVVDPFFTQPSVDYSPSVQDPQLHTAGIVAYGVRLSEKDVTAVPQLFHYLYNNFKIALGNGKLEQECRILSTAVRNAHVASFMLQYMIPATILAAAQVNDCWALLEVYTVALGNLLDGACVPKELADEDMEHVAGLLNCILAWFDGLRSAATAPSLQQLHIMVLLASLADTLQPSLTVYLFNNPSSPIPGLEYTLNTLFDLFTEARTHLTYLLSIPHDDLGHPTEPTIYLSSLLSGLPPSSATSFTTTGRNPRVQDFASTIVSDVLRNWVVSENSVMVRMASGRAASAVGLGLPAMTQGGQGAAAASLKGVKYGSWEGRALAERLWGALRRWEGNVGVASGNAKEMGRARYLGRGRKMRRGSGRERVVDGGELIF
ncbi:hypothetical protein VTI74DRAFT_2063 [Chaetomium olivicolor]